MTTASLVPESDRSRSVSLAELWKRQPVARTLSNAFIRFRYADGFSFARSMAFQIVLALLPGLIFIVALATRLGDGRLQSMIRETMETVAPGPASELLLGAFQQGTEAGRANALAIVIGGLAAITAGVGGMAQLQRGASRIYGVLGDRPTVQRYGLATVLTLTVGVLLILGFLAIVLGASIGGTFQDEIAEIWGWARWPLGVLVVSLGLGALFKYAPNRQQPKFPVLALGGLVAVLGWLLTSVLLAVYLNTSTAFGETYGPLAGFIGMLLWAQFTGIAIFFGIAVAAEVEAEYAGVTDPTSDPQPTGEDDHGDS